MSDEAISLGTNKAQQPQQPQPSNPPKVRRRNRIITSCLECRRRKLKCDRLHPCNHCAKAARDCVFLSPAVDSVTKGKLNQFKESIDNLEKGLERHAEGSGQLEWTISGQSRNPASADRSRIGLSPDSTLLREPIPADEANLEPSPLAVVDVTYDDDGDDLMEDLGVKMGKVRITERIGGFVRPRFAEEVADTIRNSGDFDSNPALQMQIEAITSPPQSTDAIHSFLEPSSEYIAPGETLLFPTSGSDETSLIAFLPSRDFADKLITQYWNVVHLVARVVHRPTFERQYDQFWQDVAQGFEPPNAVQALVFGVMFSAAVSLPSDTTDKEYGCSRDDMIRTFRSGCEYALSRSNLLRTTKFSTMQAFVLYLLPICRADVSRSHASLVSMAIRLAECASLHRDGTTFGLSPVEVHVRRLVWYQLCFLDIRTVEAVGPRPSIREAEYDTNLPLHVDDTELESLLAPKQDAARFTEMTAARIKFESFEVLRMIWVERPLIQKGQSSLTSLLRKVEEFREYSLQKYMPILDKSIPIQNYAAKLLQLLLYKMHVNVLHLYAVSVPQQMPERLMQVLWSSSTGVLEISMEMETIPSLKPWAWYIGAYSQYHVALLLLHLVLMTPDRPEADRVWAALDWIFEFPDHLSRNDKVKLAMFTASYRLDEYQKQRKRRAQISVDQNLGRSMSPPQQQRKDSRDTSASSPYQPLPTPANSDIAFTAPPPDLSSTDHWLNAQTSRGSSMGYASPTGIQSQQHAMNMMQQAPLPSAFQYMPAPNIQQAPSAPQNVNNAQDGGSQPFADLDWDELNRLFPLDAPVLSFEPQPATTREERREGLAHPMIYFP